MFRRPEKAEEQDKFPTRLTLKKKKKPVYSHGTGRKNIYQPKKQKNYQKKVSESRDTRPKTETLKGGSISLFEKKRGEDETESD